MNEKHQKMIDEFKSLLTSTKREGIDLLLLWLEKETDFFSAPASTRFHNNFISGLLDHSLKVYKIFKKEIEIHSKQLEKLSGRILKDDSVIITALLHDLCKLNTYVRDVKNVKREGTWVQEEYWKFQDSIGLGHGDKSVILIQRFIELSDDEIYLIYYHMGYQNDYKLDSGLDIAKKKCPEVTLLHVADLLSSDLYEITI